MDTTLQKMARMEATLQKMAGIEANLQKMGGIEANLQKLVSQMEADISNKFMGEYSNYFD